MSPKDERFLQRKFDIQPGDSIDTRLEQQLTTAMRLDLFYQTAECRTVGGADGVSVVLIAGNRADQGTLLYKSILFSFRRKSKRPIVSMPSSLRRGMM